MTYFIEVKQTGDKDKEFDAMWFEMKGSNSVDDLKDRIEADTGIAATEQRLIFGGKPFHLGTVEELVIASGEKETCRLHLTLEMLGGGTSGFMRRI